MAVLLTETPWRGEFNRVGVYWQDPWHLEYYNNGELVRTVSGPSQIDPLGYANGTGLNKAQHIIIDAEDQGWRSDNGIARPTQNSLTILKVSFWSTGFAPTRR